MQKEVLIEVEEWRKRKAETELQSNQQTKKIHEMCFGLLDVVYWTWIIGLGWPGWVGNLGTRLSEWANIGVG